MGEPAVLRYLERAEERVTDPWERDDYRLAWLVAYYASQGDPAPFLHAHYQVFGCAPEKLQQKIEIQRKARLGSWYEVFYPPALPPKKPVAPAPLPVERFKTGTYFGA